MFVYILTNDRRTVLYTGVTNDIDRRIAEHRAGEGSAFARRYNLRILVWMEQFPNPTDAIAMEKRIKGWRREKKVALIEAVNPDWRDLSRWELDRANPSS